MARQVVLAIFASKDIQMLPIISLYTRVATYSHVKSSKLTYYYELSVCVGVGYGDPSAFRMLIAQESPALTYTFGS